MARNKEKETVKESRTFNVDEGLSFDFEETPEAENIKPAEPPKPKKAKNTTEETERNYSVYYTPKPKTGKRGGVIGHPPVTAEMRRKPVSFYCSDIDKQRYLEAAKKDGRKFPDFVNKALEEYIENHNL